MRTVSRPSFSNSARHLASSRTTSDQEYRRQVRMVAAFRVAHGRHGPLLAVRVPDAQRDGGRLSSPSPCRWTCRSRHDAADRGHRFCKLASIAEGIFLPSKLEERCLPFRLLRIISRTFPSVAVCITFWPGEKAVSFDPLLCGEAVIVPSDALAHRTYKSRSLKPLAPLLNMARAFRSSFFTADTALASIPFASSAVPNSAA
jgi:hypothetical protein